MKRFGGVYVASHDLKAPLRAIITPPRTAEPKQTKPINQSWVWRQ
jgi:hypothetical protein